MTPEIPASPYDGWTDAAIHVDLAQAVIETFRPETDTRHDLRLWWVNEKEHRKQYGLSKVQSESLLELCKVVAVDLPDDGRPDPSLPVAKPKKTFTPKRQAA